MIIIIIVAVVAIIIMIFSIIISIIIATIISISIITNIMAVSVLVSPYLSILLSELDSLLSVVLKYWVYMKMRLTANILFRAPWSTIGRLPTRFSILWGDFDWKHWQIYVLIKWLSAGD